MSFPRTKRQRTEEEFITRSDIWYEDGSVVLQADNTQFRIHWSVLALNSSFFRDMHGFPQPPSADCCPVVELSADVADVNYLLKALYSPTVTFLVQTPVPLPAVGALIRLGNKYDFRSLLDVAVSRLTFENPTTLEEYDALAPSTTRIVPYPGIGFDMTALASEHNILTALPCAYYRLATYNQSLLFEGLPRPDGSSASLPLPDLRKCVVGRERLLSKQFQEGFTLGWLRKWEYDDCTNPAGCSHAREAVLHHCMDASILGCLQLLGDNWRSLLCAACYQHAADSNTAGRKKMWEELPAVFDLPPWKELNNDL